MATGEDAITAVLAAERAHFARARPAIGPRDRKHTGRRLESLLDELRQISGGGVGPENARAVAALFDEVMATGLAVKQIARATAQGEAVGRALAGDPDILAARENWSALSDNKRRRHVRAMVAKVAGMLDFAEPPKTRFTHEPDSLTSGYFDDEEMALVFNTNPALFGDHDDLMNTTMHELIHARQVMLHEMIEDQPENFSAEAKDWSRVIALNYGLGEEMQVCIGGTEDFEGYRNQPMEAEAFAAGDAASSSFGRSLMSAPEAGPDLAAAPAPRQDSRSKSTPKIPAPRQPAR